MLPLPEVILAAGAARTPLRYRWDEWNVAVAYRPGDEAFAERMGGFTYRANVAFCTAMAEWAVRRFDGVSSDPTPHQFIEAAWAAVVHPAYARYSEFEDDEWRGIVRGPLRITMAVVVDLIWNASGEVPGRHCGWMSQLVSHLLPDAVPFLQWRNGAVRRLTAWPGALESNEPDDVFGEEEWLGVPVPRELFFEPEAIDPLQVYPLLDAFISRLDPRANPFLHLPEEMAEFEDYHGQPYSLSPRDIATVSTRRS